MRNKFRARCIFAWSGSGSFSAQKALHLCVVILVSEAAVFAWSGYVPAGRNFQQYRPYLEMARDGRRKRRPGRLRGYQGPAPEQAVPIPLFVRRLRYGSLVEEFIQPIRVGSTFRMRAKPKCSPLARRMLTERMGEESILKAPALIGMRKRQCVKKLTGESTCRQGPE